MIKRRRRASLFPWVRNLNLRTPILHRVRKPAYRCRHIPAAFTKDHLPALIPETPSTGASPLPPNPQIQHPRHPFIDPEPHTLLCPLEHIRMEPFVETGTFQGIPSRNTMEKRSANRGVREGGKNRVRTSDGRRWRGREVASGLHDVNLP